MNLGSERAILLVMDSKPITFFNTAERSGTRCYSAHRRDWHYRGTSRTDHRRSCSSTNPQAIRGKPFLPNQFDQSNDSNDSDRSHAGRCTTPTHFRPCHTNPKDSASYFAQDAYLHHYSPRNKNRLCLFYLPKNT